MKTSSITKTLFWAMFIACSFQFSLMIPTGIIENKAETQAELYAHSFPAAQQAAIKEQYVQNYLDSIAEEVLFAIPYVVEYTYPALKKQQLQLGLDLKGGVQVTLGLNAAAFITNLASQSTNTLFVESLAQTQQMSSLTLKESIHYFFDVYTQVEKEETILRLFSKHPQVQQTAATPTSIATLKNTIFQLAETTLQHTQLLLTQRTNSLGLGQTNITEDLDNLYIHVELPGATNPERVREMLLATASLEFWETYRVTDPGIMEGLQKVFK